MARRPKLTARTADKHLLYEASVQGAEQDIALVRRLFKRHSGREPRSLREDFCGTALVAAEFVKKNAVNVAVGLDLDRPTLEWAEKHNRAPLGAAASRLTLIEQDVLVPTRQRFDVILATNYSYSVFKTRATMKKYFEAVRKSLAPDGIFIMDAWGGWETHALGTERRVVDGFGYTWERSSYDPISSHIVAYIHFDFPDRTKMRRAFTYDWRLWQLAELRELLVEAGLREAEVLWEGDDGKGGGNGVFRPVTRANNDPSWNAYLVTGRAKP